MKKLIRHSFIVIVVAATVYLLYQSQRAYLKSEIVGLTSYEQTLFSAPTLPEYWGYIKTAYTTDSFLKKFKFNQIKRRLRLKVKKDRLIFKLTASDFENPRYSKLLDKLVLTTKKYLEHQVAIEADRLKDKANNLKLAYQRARKLENNYFRANEELTGTAFSKKKKDLLARLSTTRSTIKTLKRKTRILRSLESDVQFSLLNVDIDLPSVKRFRGLEQQYDELRIRYKTKHPKMVTIQAELVALKGIIFESLERQKSILRSRVRKIKASLIDLKRLKARSVNIRNKLGRLQQKTAEQKRLYAETVKGHTNLRNHDNYRVVASTLSGGALASAPKAVRFFGGLFAFILLCVALFIVFNRKIYQPNHISKQNVSLLAVMPKLKKEHRVPLHSHYQPDSFYSKSMTLVRNRLLTQFHNKPSVLLVSSASANRGPVSPVSNLCISLAQSQKRVLLIDCQLKNPLQHKFFRLDNDGLAEILHDGLEPSQAISKVEVPNLAVLPAGLGLTLKSLCSDAFEALIKTCRSQYDFVILDAPPLSSVTDSILISQRTDGVLLTIPSGKVTRQTLTWVKSELQRANVPLIGVILKDVATDLATEWNKVSVSKPNVTV